jgi:DNA-binding CsgD family transcriptional regulator/tetratricopeptide (TPR) repeat protein
MHVVAGRISSAELVGRGEALATLRAAVVARPADPRPVVLVAGDAGIGKTRVLAAFSESLAGDPPTPDRAIPLVLSGGCPELTGGQLPFAPVIEILDQLGRDGIGESDRVAALRGDLTGAAPAAPPSPVLSATGLAPPDRAARFGGVHDLLVSLSAVRPVVLILDDLHWADQSTLDLVTYLAGRLRDRPVLLVLAFRSDELSRRHPLRPVLANLARASILDRIDLRPLDDADVARQVASIVGARPAAPLLARWTQLADGNPFYVEELVALGVDTSLPPSLREVLGARFDVLDEAPIGVVRRAAVIGRRFDLRLLAAVSTREPEEGRPNGQPEAGAADGLTAAVEARILEPDPDGRHYRFRHALLREAAYEDLLPTDRIALHRAIAAALTEEPELSEGGASGAAAEIAFHWEAVRLPARALPSFVAAAHAAFNAHAWFEAATAVERALELWAAVEQPEAAAGSTRGEILELGVIAAWWTGDTRRSLALLTAAVAEPDVAADPKRLGRLLIHEAWCRGELDDPEGSLAAVERALKVIPREPPTRLLAEAVGTFGVRRGSTGFFRESLDLYWESYRVGVAADAHGPAANAAAAAASALSMLGREREALEALELCLASYELARDDPDTIGTLSTWLPWLGMDLARYEDGLAAVDGAFEDTRRIGADWGFGPWLLGPRIEILFWLGRWAEAEADLAASVTVGQSDVADAYFALDRSRLAALRGDADEAERQLDKAWPNVRTSDVQDPVYGAITTAIGALLSGDGATALGRFAWCRRVMEDVDSPVLWGQALTHVGPACAAIADRAEARHDASTAEAARDEGDRWVTAFRRADATLAAADPGADGRALAMWRAGARAAAARLTGVADPAAFGDLTVRARALGNRVVEMLARLEEGRAWLQAATDREAATTALDGAVAVAADLGATAVIDAAMRLAAAARLRLGSVGSPSIEPVLAKPAAADPWGLSPRERDVLALVAAGHTNREIGEALFISEKTASVHVTHILDKLGVGSRTEAALLAARGTDAVTSGPHPQG